jgi:hypothetical protein
MTKLVKRSIKAIDPATLKQWTQPLPPPGRSWKDIVEGFGGKIMPIPQPAYVDNTICFVAGHPLGMMMCLQGDKGYDYATGVVSMAYVEELKRKRQIEEAYAVQCTLNSDGSYSFFDIATLPEVRYLIEHSPLQQKPGVFQVGGLPVKGSYYYIYPHFRRDYK